MVALTKFVRNTGREYRNAVLDTIGISYPAEWKTNTSVSVADIKDILNNKPMAEQEQIRTVSEQILQLSQDELGQETILSVAKDMSSLKSLENPFDRSAWLFCQEPEAFKRAEHYYFHDAHRNGRMWARYQLFSSAGLDKRKVYQAFYYKLKAYFKDSETFVIEIYDRVYESASGQRHTVYQVMIYREGVPCLFSEVDRKDLQSKIVKPARETTMLWNSHNGQLEIISNKKKDREVVSRLFAEQVLASPHQPAEIPPREYDLNKLRVLPRPSFPSVLGDGISQVSVRGLVFKSRKTGVKYYVNVPAQYARDKDVYDVLLEDRQQTFLDAACYDIAGARLSVRYMKRGTDRQRTKVFDIAQPSSCSLKATAAIDQKLYRLLVKWELVKQHRETQYAME